MRGATGRGQERARAFLVKCIENHRRQGKERLPVVGELARTAGVAPATMHKALRWAAEQGLITTSHGKGTRLCPHNTQRVAPYPDPVSPGRLKWERVAYALRRDILNGRYVVGGELPTIKELRGEYGAGYPLVKKACERLVKDGILTPFGRSYRIAPSATAPTSSAIVLVAQGSPDGALSVKSPRFEEKIRTLERLCTQRNIRLRVVPYHKESQTLFDEGGKTTAAALVKRHSILGFMFWSIDINREEGMELIRRMHSTGIPLTVLFESSGGYDPRELSRRYPRVRFFDSVLNEPAGYRVGRYLLEKGHREVAYISPSHAAGWAQQRLAGLQRAFADAGLCGAVHAFTSDKDGKYSYIPSGYDWHHPRVHQRPAPFVTRFRVYEATAVTYMQESVDTLLDRAARLSRITAWVGSSDAASALCLDYARRHRLTIPTAISLIGFDDGQDAVRLRFTSYNFNPAGAVQAMLHCIVAPWQVRAGQDGVERVEGMITERGTVCGRRSIGGPKRE